METTNVMEFEEIINRIKEIKDNYRYTERAFSIKLGIPQNTINYQLGGTRKLSVTTIVAILECFPDISAEWLMRGKGEMFASKDARSAYDTKLFRLIDTITLLQEAINEKDGTIALLKNAINK